ncbi:hypothetical protein WJX72_002962 [[Myrmecia] bisecta]|uniref:Uncharacterized protein n=1 Tax=[Myrmecia] bisecta TaxID=41462 RepID=A0AAW1Q0H9_9CHLO
MKRKKPKPLVAPPMRSMKRARKVTSAFHELTRQIEGAKEAGDRGTAKQAEAELEALGGRASYQEASVLTTSRHRTCKWVFSLLTKYGLRPGKGVPPLPVLEVGAVNGQLMSIPWLRHLQQGGHLFVMVPLRCLTHSPYTTWESFQRALELVGFQVKATKTSPKVAFLCAQAVEVPEPGPQLTAALAEFAHPPKVITPGAKNTNDFAICYG